jgi:hypothetical protein
MVVIVHDDMVPFKPKVLATESCITVVELPLSNSAKVLRDFPLAMTEIGTTLRATNGRDVSMAYTFGLSASPDSHADVC